MKIKHYSIFHRNVLTLNWEALRNDKVEEPYFIPYTKSDYISKVDVNAPSELATIILKMIQRVNLNNLFSIGSGIASLEYQFKKFSNLNIVISDYNSSVLRLQEYDIFDNAIKLDAIKDAIPVDSTWIVLFPRIDTEFKNEQLTLLFEKCFNSGVKYVCFIPAELLSIRIILAEIKILLICLLKRRKRVFCGYARSMDEFKKIWNPYYHISTANKSNKKVIFLEINNDKKY